LNKALVVKPHPQIPMKIVHVVYSLEMGGAESLVAQLCRLQRANGNEVSVCACTNLGALGEALRSEGFRIDVLGPSSVMQGIWRCFQLLRSIRPEVVHCHNPAPTLLAVIGARLSGAISVISTRHSLVAPPYDVAAEIKYSILARLCDHIVGICEATCENLRHAPLALRDRIVRVYNGSSAVERMPLEDCPPKPGFTILFVGRLAPIKDLPTLVNAIALALPRVPNLNLWLVGDGQVRKQLEDLTASLGISCNVTFWGERHDVAQFFSAADLFSMSSLSEGLPMSLLQSMSVGLPALVTQVGGMAEVVELSDCGLRVPVGDSAAMADAIVQLASNPALRNQFAANAVAAYSERFTIEQMDAAYMRLYRAR
jgi:glycosyltransferase involved in cell wall biosynthesis